MKALRTDSARNERLRWGVAGAPKNVAGLMLLLALACASFGALAAEEPPPERIEGPKITIASPSASMPGVPNESSRPPAVKPNAIVEQPRSFGYVIGDVFTQRVLLVLDGHPFVPAELPEPGRAGIWFERRAVRTETDSQGRQWLAIDYQLMNSPQALAIATLPAWKLVSKEPGANPRTTAAGDAAGRIEERHNSELRVAEWPMTVAPLTPEKAFARASLGTLRPDRAPVLVPVVPVQRALTLALVLLTATVAAWLGWWLWRNYRASASQPFALAVREMRHVDGTSAEAWLALHRAFDGTAGRALRAETLPGWFARAPQFAPLRAPIEQFFTQSAARFFAGQPPAQPVSVHALCRELRRIEKRHEP